MRLRPQGLKAQSSISLVFPDNVHVSSNGSVKAGSSYVEALHLLHASERSTQETQNSVFKQPAHPQVAEETSAFCCFLGWQTA